MKSMSRSHSEPRDAIELLRAQHDEIEDLFEVLVRVPSSAPAGVLVPELADLCAVHLAIEERIFYPGIGWAPSEDHGETEGLLAAIVDADRKNAPLIELARRAGAQLRVHARLQERRVFPHARRSLDAVRLRRLAYEMRVLEFELRTNMNLRVGAASAAVQPALA